MISKIQRSLPTSVTSQSYELSLLAQTSETCMQIKVEALGHKKARKQMVSSGTPQQFHNFISWLKSWWPNYWEWGYVFERGCGLLDDQHSCAGVLSRNRYLSWFPNAARWAWQRKCKSRWNKNSARVSITYSHPSRQLFALQHFAFRCQEKKIFQLPRKPWEAMCSVV